MRATRLAWLAIATSIGGCSSSTEGTGVAVRLELVTPAGMEGTPGWATEPIIVEALDANGDPVPNVPITWVAGNGTRVSGWTKTNFRGRAEATLTIGLAEGAYGLSASAPGVLPVTVSLRATTLHAVAVTAGDKLGCALTEAGTAYCWGYNSLGRIGAGTSEARQFDRPVPVAGGHRFRSISAAGTTHVCALDLDDQTWCWGYHIGLGSGLTDGFSPAPVAVQTTERFATISAMDRYMDGTTCGLTRSGATLCWGDNKTGRVGDGTSVSALVPVAVLEQGFEKVIGGMELNCGIKAGGTLWCWGEQDQPPGNFGGIAAGNQVPQPLHAGLAFTSIASGWGWACGIATDARTWCWGRNWFGSLGDGRARSSATPVEVAGGHHFTLLSSTYGEGIFALDQDGKLYHWGGYEGDHSHGTPTLIAPEFTLVTMDAMNAPDNAIGIREDGSVWEINLFGHTRGVPAPAP